MGLPDEAHVRPTVKWVDENVAIESGRGLWYP